MIINETIKNNAMKTIDLKLMQTLQDQYNKGLISQVQFIKILIDLTK